MIVYTGALTESIRATGVPIVGLNSHGRVDPANLQAAAQPLIDAWDDSDAAQALRDRDAARAAAKALLTVADAISDHKLLKALLLLVLDQHNEDRARHGLAPRTIAQLRTALAAKLDAGEAD